MKYIIDTDTLSVVGPLTNTATKTTAYKKDMKQVFEDMQSFAPIDTGLLPVQHSGLLSYRARDGYEQITFQIEPGIYTVKWGQRERDPNAVLYQLAMPYRIIIADFKDNLFIGARHFFSMTPAYGWETQLYATGFSNTNNVGYRHTSIGWICLYHDKDPIPFENLSQKIDYFVNRESGLAEPYNYNNMSETDGPMFYQMNMPDKNHFHNAAQWATKTANEGLDWVLDPSNFIPYRTIVTDEYYAQAHTTKSGSIPYLLLNATHNNYAPYYGMTQTKPINDLNAIDYITSITSILRPSEFTSFDYVPETPQVSAVVPFPKFTQAALAKPKILEGKLCVKCSRNYSQDEQFFNILTSLDNTLKTFISEQLWCNDCVINYSTTMFINGDPFLCDTSYLYWNDEHNLWYFPWDAVSCDSCGEVYPNSVDFETEFYVYGSDLSMHSACIYCLDEEEHYETDYITKKNVLYDYITRVKMLQFTFPQAEEGKLLPTSPILSLVDTKIHTQFVQQVCKCGIFNEDVNDLCKEEKNESGEITCKTCVNSNLISLETITPVAVEQKDIKI